MATEYIGLSYSERLRIYESKKALLAQICSDWQKYEKCIKELITELGI